MEVPGHIECDECQTPKRHERGWLIAVVSTDPEMPGIAFGRYEDKSRVLPSDNRVVKDLCGQACAAKHFHLWLDTL